MNTEGRVSHFSFILELLQYCSLSPALLLFSMLIGHWSLMFNFDLSLSLLIVHCNLSISLCYLDNALLISLLSMLQHIDLNGRRQ